MTDDGPQVKIDWDGYFNLVGNAFSVDVDVPAIGRRDIHGYPLSDLRDAIRKVESFEHRANEVFVNRETVPLTESLISQLESEGWERVVLEQARDAGAEYSPKRGSLLFPIEAG